MANDILQQLVVFHHAGERYALPIGSVQEIIRYEKPRRVDGGRSGVINLRGRIVPIVDLALWLGRPATAVTERTTDANVIIVEGRDGPLGVVVDGVDGVTTVPGDALSDVPVNAAPVIDCIVTIEDRLVASLDPQQLAA